MNLYADLWSWIYGVTSLEIHKEKLLERVSDIRVDDGFVIRLKRLVEGKEIRNREEFRVV